MRRASKKPKIIVILGPTASGKSDLAIFLAKKLKTEIISADSRQIYKQMDIATGKITKKEMGNIPHHLISILTPDKQFSVSEYKILAKNKIEKIIKQNKIPIICGGTGFYIRAIVDNISIPEVKPNKILRTKLNKKSLKDLMIKLQELDPHRAKTIDPRNKLRLIRAIEIVIQTGKPIPELKNDPQYNALFLGIKISSKNLKNKINKRVDKMTKLGLKKELENLRKKYGWTSILKNTIGYKEWNSSLNEKEIINQIKKNSFDYSKRQITWFSKYTPKTHWIKNNSRAEKLVKKFIKSN